MPLPTPDKMAVLERRIAKQPDGCWLWLGARTSGGYGQVQVRGKTVPVHRLVYELLVGEVADGLTLDHRCRVRHCCNPEHLEPVTGRENTLRGEGPTAQNARKTHCPNGHAYDEIVDGARSCSTCRRARRRGYYHRSKEAVA